jgi:hypothetical protein
MNAYGGRMGAYLHIFINLALEVNGQLHPSHFTPITHSKGGWAGPRASLDILGTQKSLSHTITSLWLSNL